jgi:hypothetical protein
MELPSEPGLRLNIYTDDPDTPAADGLKLLASWAASHAADSISSLHGDGVTGTISGSAASAPSR